MHLFLKSNRAAINVHKKADVPIGRDLVYTAESEVPRAQQKVVLAFFPGPKMTWKIMGGGNLWAGVVHGLF